MADCTENDHVPGRQCVSVLILDEIETDHSVVEHHDIKALSKLKPIPTAQYNRDQACLQGTREELLDEIKSWSQSLDVLVRLYWLFGLAGSGKSAIATTVCQLLRQSGVLASSFFCKRDTSKDRLIEHLRVDCCK